jgi:hypothetical protein
VGGSRKQRVEHCLLISEGGNIDSISLNDAVSLVWLGRVPVQGNCPGAGCSSCETSWSSRNYMDE